MTELADKGSVMLADATTTATAGAARVEHKGRARYYFYVLSCLQLLQSLMPVHGTPYDAGHAGDGYDSSGDNAVAERWSALCEAMQGAPVSLCHSGPLSARQLHALSDVSDDDMRALWHALARRRGMEHAASHALPHSSSHETGMSLFPVLSELRERLWPADGDDGAASVQARFSAAVAEAHKGRARYSEQLLEQGYLHEAGLTALRVLADVSAERAAVGQSAALRREWAALIDAYTLFLPDRSCVHELENLPQEIAIGELVADCVRRVRATDAAFALRAVVDVGGGNGFLAAQLAERLDCDGLVIDPYYPAHAIDCGPRRWPDTQARLRPAHARRRALRRHMAFFKDTLWARDVGSSPAHTALVAKHLCGSAVDECLRHLQAQHCLPRILILAPCCFPKIDTQTYCNTDFLRDEMGVDSQDGFARLTRLTDWNVSCYGQVHEVRLQQRRRGADRRAAGCDLRDQSDAQRVLAALDHCDGDAGPSSRPHRFAGGGRSIARQVPCMHAFSQYVEALVNEGRVRWLRAQGYDAQVTQYVPACVTPKNKCIVAVRTHGVRDKGRCKL